MPIVRPEDPGPLRPGVIPPPRSRRPRQQLKVDDRLGSVTHRSTNTVVTRITPTDHDDVFILGIDIAAFFKLAVEERLGVQLGIRRMSI